MRLSALCLALAVSLLTPTPVTANITDSIEFPYNTKTFDSETRYGTEYQDSLVLANWNRLRTGKAPFNGDLTLVFSQNVNRKKYSFETDLISPSGKVIPLTLKSQYVSESQFSINCLGTYCQTIMFTYGADLPIGSEVGKYLLRFTARWIGVRCTGTVCESGIPLSKSVEAKGALEILGEVTPTPSATPIATPIATTTSASKSTISCFKGKTVKKVTAVNPKCPKGYKKK